MPAGRRGRRLRRLAVAAGFLVFAVLYHAYFVFTGNLFALRGRDSTLQDLYFVDLLQKQLLAGQFDWSWSCGLGGGLLGGFGYYYSTSPFFYLMTLPRLLGIGTWDFAGIARWKLVFSILKQCLMMGFLYTLLRREGKRAAPAFAGALCYGGSVLFLRYTVAFDFMVDAYVWLPLTLLGFVRFHRTHRPWLMLAGLTLTAVSNFYFAFINFVFYAVYLLAFAPVSGRGVRARFVSLCRWLRPYLLYALLSLGLAAVFFWPAVRALLACDRFGRQAALRAFFTAGFYLQLPEKLFGAFVFGLPSVLLLLLFVPWRVMSGQAKRKTVLFWVWLAAYLIPVLSCFLVGLTYVSDRWCYLLVFSAAYLLPDLLETNVRTVHAARRLAFFYLAAGAVCLLTRRLRGLARAGWMELVHFAANLPPLLMLAALPAARARRQKRRLRVLFCAALGAAFAVQAVLYAAAAFVPETAASLRASGMQDAGTAALYAALTPDASHFYRTVSRDTPYENDAMAYGYYGAAAYSSLVDARISQWMRLRFNVLEPYVSVNRYQNFDDRLFLETAFGVRYVTTSREDSFQPYGYTLKRRTAQYNVYENQYTLGLGLWYDTAVPESTFSAWNTAQRDAMLLRTAVVADAAAAGYAAPDEGPGTVSVASDWGAAIFSHAALQNGVIVAKAGASIRIPLHNSAAGQAGEMLVQFDLRPQGGAACTVGVNGKQTVKTEESGNWTYPITQYTFRIDGGVDTAVLTLSPGRYRLSGWNVWFNSYASYVRDVRARGSRTLTGLQVHGGTVQANFETDETGILALSIPCVDGWEATVNGHAQRILCVNGLFSGLALSPGKYRIVFRYRAPGLLAGACVSAGALALAVLSALMIRHRQKKGGRKGRPALPDAAR